MGQALYRKYRSKSLDEIVGQEHITDTLKRAIEAGRVSHAYLFTGPRGVGKTSIARILAHELNGLSYTGEDSHLDIIEIDAASNGGVDEVRELRDKVYIAPSQGQYKVYIIDEVHMMTTPAFNALLKTLEEPPAHAIFILATTEAHKVPATIVSRTQRFTFRPIPPDKVANHLRTIAGQEHMDITGDALALIAEHGGGSFRDSIGMLDQAAGSHKKVGRAEVEQLLGIPPISAINGVIGALRAGNAQGIARILGELYASGYQAGPITKQLSAILRSALINGQPLPAQPGDIQLLKRFIDVPASTDPERLLELILIEAALLAAPLVQLPAPVPNHPAKVAPAHRQPGDGQAHSQGKAAPAVAAAPAVHTLLPIPKPSPDDESKDCGIVIDGAMWQAVLDTLKKQYNTLYGITRMARPEFQPGKVKLTFGFAFHQKRADDAKNKKVIMAILEEVTGQHLGIDCYFDKTVTPPAPAIAPLSASTAASTPNPALSAISSVFGGGEVLEP